MLYAGNMLLRYVYRNKQGTLITRSNKVSKKLYGNAAKRNADCKTKIVKYQKINGNLVLNLVTNLLCLRIVALQLH